MVKVTSRTTTIKQQSTKCGSERNGGGGDGNGDGDCDGNSEGNSGRRRRWRRHSNGGDSDGHGGDGCRFLGIANLIEVRKANCQIEEVFRFTYNGLDGILFRRIMDRG